MAQSVIAERRGRTLLLTMNRDDTRNALTSDVIEGLCSELLRAEADRSLSCVVITGTGRSFSSGGHLQELLDLGDPALTLEDMKQWYRNGVHRLPKLICSLSLVTIAAVNGFAVGAGCDLTAMCDLRVAGKNATFAESFLRVGIIPGDGGAWLLSRLIGTARTKEMLFSASPVNAETALHWGLVNRVSPDETLVEDALAWADQIAQLPPEALRQAKRLFNRVDRATLDDHLESAVDIQVQLQRLDDHKEAVQALMERRAPSFKGSVL